MNNRIPDHIGADHIWQQLTQNQRQKIIDIIDHYAVAEHTFDPPERYGSQPENSVPYFGATSCFLQRSRLRIRPCYLRQEVGKIGDSGDTLAPELLRLETEHPGYGKDWQPEVRAGALTP